MIATICFVYETIQVYTLFAKRTHLLHYILQFDLYNIERWTLSCYIFSVSLIISE